MSNVLFLSLFVLMSCFNSDANLPHPIVVRLKLQTIETKNYGTINAVEIVIKNNSNRKVYLMDILPIHLELFKQSSDGAYEDYFDNWVYGELNSLENRDSINSFIGNNNTFNKVYDVLNKKFIDPLALNFYQSTKKSKDLRSDADTLAIRLWTRKKFENVLYLNPGEEYRCAESITSLEKGSYRIHLYYSNLDGGVKYITEKYNYLDLHLPEVLNDYYKWSGEIKSDTLYVNVK